MKIAGKKLSSEEEDTSSLEFESSSLEESSEDLEGKDSQESSEGE